MFRIKLWGGEKQTHVYGTSDQRYNILNNVTTNCMANYWAGAECLAFSVDKHVFMFLSSERYEVVNDVKFLSVAHCHATECPTPRNRHHRVLSK